MDVSFLIDPIHKFVTSVQDGYARAGELIGDGFDRYRDPVG
jgi:hypothetical protein